MNKNVHPVAALAVIAISVLTIAAWLWCSGEAKHYAGPAGLVTDPQGHLYVQVRNQLLEHDADGTFVARHDLSALGTDLLLGGTAFFSNGDLLLRRGPDTRSIFDTVRAYQRMTNEDTLKPEAAGAGLHRCNLDTQECRVFGASPIDFKSTFSVFIDRATDEVYISDTSRHLVRKYTPDGTAAADPVDGFRFPNQLVLHDGVLLVADTNHFRIRGIRPTSKGFGRELSLEQVVPDEAYDKGQRWPSHFIRVGDRWWVNNMSTAMDYGGIYVFDDEWQFERRLELPENADPIALIRFNDEVLVSDWYGNRVHRVSMDGRALGDFESTGLTEILTESAEQRKVYTIYAWLAVAFGAMLVLVIVIKGTDWQGKKPVADDSRNATPIDEPLLLEPNAEHVKKLRRSMHFARVLLVPAVLAIPVLMVLTKKPEIIAQLLVSGIGFVAMILLVDWMSRANMGTSIRIDSDRVTLCNHRGETAKSALSKVFFSDNAIVAGNMAVFFGQGKTPIYDKDRVLEELTRRIPASQRISQWAMGKKLLAIRHPLTLAGIATVFVLILVLVATY